MNTLDNSIDRLLADVSEEAVKADAELLEGFARTEIPEDVRHRTLTAVKTGNRTSTSERLYRKAASIAAAFVAVICIACAANIYATYERKEIWGIDIVDEGDYFTVSIISTQRSKNIVEKKRAPSIEPKNADKKTEQDRITSYITVYHQNDSTIMVYSQYCSTVMSVLAAISSTVKPQTSRISLIRKATSISWLFISIFNASKKYFNKNKNSSQEKS